MPWVSNPVNPANGVYAIGLPVVSKATIALPKGKSFVVKVNNAEKENAYIQSVKLNGQPYEKTYLTHANILAGGMLEFTMGASPNKSWGTGADAVPLEKVDGMR